MKRPIVIVVALVIGVVALWYYMSLQPPAGIEVKSSEGDATIQWIALATAVVSLLTAVTGLIQEVVKARAARQGS